MKIIVETTVDAPIEQVWSAYTTPKISSSGMLPPTIGTQQPR